MKNNERVVGVAFQLGRRSQKPWSPTHTLDEIYKWGIIKSSFFSKKIILMLESFF